MKISDCKDSFKIYRDYVSQCFMCVRDSNLYHSKGAFDPREIFEMYESFGITPRVLFYIHRDLQEERHNRLHTSLDMKYTRDSLIRNYVGGYKWE